MTIYALDTVLLAQNDEPFMDGDKQMTALEVCKAALLSSQLDGMGRPVPITLEDQIKRGDLYLRLKKEGAATSLESEEVTLIKKLVAERFPVPLITVQVVNIFKS